jgi:hypothetical protein
MEAEIKHVNEGKWHDPLPNNQLRDIALRKTTMLSTKDDHVHRGRLCAWIRWQRSVCQINSHVQYLEISIVWERALWVLSSPLQSVVGADRGSLTNKSSMLMSSVAIDGSRVADLFLITPVLTI